MKYSFIAILLLLLFFSPIITVAQDSETDDVNNLIHAFHNKIELLRTEGHEASNDVLSFLSSAN